MSYIAPAAKALRHLDRLVGWHTGQRPAPVTIEWDLSNRCTLGCQDCHFAHTHVRGPWAGRGKTVPMAYQRTGDLADLALVRRALGEMARAGVRAVVWSGGGEPTTHPHWLDAVIAAQAVGLEQGMYTHGGHLTPLLAERLARMASWVVVSLDAARADVYAREKGVPSSRFDAACDGVRSLVAARGAVVGVSFLLHGSNWRQAPEMLTCARALGATYTTFRPAVRVDQADPSVCHDDRSWIPDAAPLMAWLHAQDDVEINPDRFTSYQDWTSHGYASCYGIRLNATVTPDGRLWVCPQRRGVSGSCLGDLTTESFAAMWARHPGQWTDFSGCRVMCRLHPVNQQLWALAQPLPHEAFV